MGLRTWSKTSASKMPHIRLWEFLRTGKYASPLLCGIFEAGISAVIHHPHVPLTLHMGLLRCGLFEAMRRSRNIIRRE